MEKNANIANYSYAPSNHQRDPKKKKKKLVQDYKF